MTKNELISAILLFKVILRSLDEEKYPGCTRKELENVTEKTLKAIYKMHSEEIRPKEKKKRNQGLEKQRQRQRTREEKKQWIATKRARSRQWKELMQKAGFNTREAVADHIGKAICSVTNREITGDTLYWEWLILHAHLATCESIASLRKANRNLLSPEREPV